MTQNTRRCELLLQATNALRASVNSATVSESWPALASELGPAGLLPHIWEDLRGEWSRLPSRAESTLPH